MITLEKDQFEEINGRFVTPPITGNSKRNFVLGMKALNLEKVEGFLEKSINCEFWDKVECSNFIIEDYLELNVYDIEPEQSIRLNLSNNILKLLVL